MSPDSLAGASLAARHTRPLSSALPLFPAPEDISHVLSRPWLCASFHLRERPSFSPTPDPLFLKYVKVSPSWCIFSESPDLRVRVRSSLLGPQDQAHLWDPRRVGLGDSRTLWGLGRD